IRRFEKTKAPARRRLDLHPAICSRLFADRDRALGIDTDFIALAILVLELHDAIHEGENRVVGAESDVGPRMILGAILSNDDVAGPYTLAAKALHALVLGIAVAAVARRADAFLVCHLRIPRSAEADVVDANFSKALTVPALARVVLPSLLLEDDDLVAAAVLDDLAGDFGALQHGNARADVAAVGAEQNLVEFDVTARVADERRNAICLTR